MGGEGLSGEKRFPFFNAGLLCLQSDCSASLGLLHSQTLSFHLTPYQFIIACHEDMGVKFLDLNFLKL